MKQISNLLERIVQRVNINLRELRFDIAPHIEGIIPLDQFGKFYAFYGVTSHHPLSFHFGHCSLAGSYFLGKCRVDHSILYKSDIRGDELKKKGDRFEARPFAIQVYADESICIADSFLIKTLVHHYSHDPENLEEFRIQNTCSLHYANIHGSPTEGSFLGPFATVDLTSVHDSIIGCFSYIQAGEVAHLEVDPGTIWIRSDNDFNFLYHHSREVLDRYVSFAAGQEPKGFIMEFIEERQADFQRVFDVIRLAPPMAIPPGASVDRYAVLKPKIRLSENVLVAQRAYLENCQLGKGANAQENCYIVDSYLEGFNVTAHGAKLICARLASKVFVGFNSFLKGSPACPLTIGSGCIVMPHTIIDLTEPVTIPPDHLVWGFIQTPDDCATHTYPLEAFARIDEGLILGELCFEGQGRIFVETFKSRIEHILEANGAFFDGTRFRGHAQRNQNISFNTIQPYPEGEKEGLYPTIEIQP
jgi:carbonic anhydrase/acetyltransferase-like protein (isoleucine patch superfamily)